MMVISFDGPAHGLSSGKSTNMIEFLETIKEVDKKYGPFDAAIGHSFGAMSLINAVADGLKVNKLVAIGAIILFLDISIYRQENGVKTYNCHETGKLFEKKFTTN